MRRNGLEAEKGFVQGLGAEDFLLTTVADFSRTIKSASGISSTVGDGGSMRTRLFPWPATLVPCLGLGDGWISG